MDASSRSTASRSRLERLLLVALLVYFAILNVQYVYKMSKKDGKGSAILRWYEQLRSLQDGDDIYEGSPYPNPPIMALILTPVVIWPVEAGLPLLTVGLLWFWLKVGMTLLSLRWVFRMVESPGRPFPLSAKVLTVLLSLRAITGDLQHGNVNLFILFLVVAALAAFQSRRDFLAGLLIALGMSCKVTPAAFVPYLIWKRAWRALAGCAVGVALFFWPGFIPAIFLGWEENLKLVATWTSQMVRPFVVEGLVTSEHHNQSLPGVVYRLLTDSPSFVTYVNNVWTPTAYHNILSLPPEAAKWIVRSFMAAFALLILWSCRTPRNLQPQAKLRLAGEYSMVLLAMLLFSERTWKHHCVTLLVPFAVISYRLVTGWSNSLLRCYLIGSLVAAVLFMSAASISLFGREGGKLAQVYGVYVAAFFVLSAAITVILRQPISAPSGQIERLPLAA
jgi:hypothetical protein